MNSPLATSTVPFPSIQGNTILIIDDTPAHLRLLVEHLEVQGFRTVVAKDGMQGMERAAFDRPDLILLDVKIPDMDGFETCRRLKATERTRDLPVIFMTDLKDPSHRLMGFAAGGIDYVAKPLDMDEVTVRVVTHLTLRAVQKQLTEKNAQLQQEVAVRREAEASLQRAHEELEDRVARRTRKLVDTNAALQTQISDRRRAETSLILFRSLLDHTNDSIEVIDPETGRFLDVNEKACRDCGYTHEEYLNLRVADIDPWVAHSWEETRDEVKRLGTRIFESVHRRKDGSLFPVEVNVTYVRLKRDYLLAVVRDITERKRTEELLRKLSQAVEQSPVSIVITDTVGTIEFVNPHFSKVSGYSREEVLGEGCYMLTSGETSEEEYLQLWQTIRSGKVGRGVLLNRKKSGELFWEQETIAPLRDADNVITHYVAVKEDITERKRTEELLRKLSQAIEQSPVSVVITDTEGTIEFVNPYFCEVTGYSQAEVLGKNSRILKSGETTPAEYRRLWQTISSGGVWRGEFHNRNKNGDLFWEQSTIAPLRNEDNIITHYVAIKEDITEHKALQEQLHQAQKMESVGRLAGGVAHDFNNMLGVIIGRSDLALRKLAPDHPLFANLQEICKAAERSAELTRQLLAFARRQPVSPLQLDLNQTVEGMLKMLRRLIGEDIDLAWLPASGELPVKMDPSQLDQILANLCVNARDAIDGVGKVTIETRRMIFDAAYCASHPGYVSGDYILLAVSDDGCGMGHETLDKIFEPFFTTKDPGKGTGLGLATVYGIIRQNNGFINVYSEPGMGTTFKIYLPRHASKFESMEQENPASILAQGDETILLVEDEPLYLDVSEQMLESLGYHVLPATTPGEALRIAREHRDDIHLLITDVVMPEMNGLDLAQKLKSLQAGIRLLFISGYTSDLIAHRGILTAGINYIQKPFSLQDLATKVREVLEGK